MLYDPDEGSLFLSRGNEIITQNRYSPLSRCPTKSDCKFGASKKGPVQVFGPSQHRGFSRRGEHRSGHEYPREDPAYSFCSFCFNINDINFHDNFVCKNKIKSYAGYFSDYNHYPCVNIDKVKPDLRMFLNDYPTSLKVSILNKPIINLICVINSIL